jgi:hypothetical protein
MWFMGPIKTEKLRDDYPVNALRGWNGSVQRKPYPNITSKLPRLHREDTHEP